MGAGQERVLRLGGEFCTVIRIRIVTLVSPGEMNLYGPSSSSSGWVECVRMRLMFPGTMREKICLPVHSGLGLRMAG